MDCANVNAFFGKGGLTAMSTRQLYNFVIDATLTTPAQVDAKLASLEANAGEEGEHEREEDAVFMQTWTPSSLSEVANCEGDQKMRAAGQREGAYSDAVAHLLGSKSKSEEGGEEDASEEEEEEKEKEGGAPNGKAVRNRKGSGPANQDKRGAGGRKAGNGSDEAANKSNKPKPRPILLARSAEELTKPKTEGEASNGKEEGEDDDDDEDEDEDDDEDPRSAGWEWDGHAEGRLPPAGSEARDFAKSAKKVGRRIWALFCAFSFSNQVHASNLLNFDYPSSVDVARV